MSGSVSRKWVVFALVAVGVFMSTLDSSIVNIALPYIMRDLSETLPVIQWVVAIYLLIVSSLLLSFGRLSDILGRRTVYCRGLLVFSAGSLACALAPSAAFLIAARALQGLGAAMIMSCTQALVVDVFPPEERGRALGMVGTVVASGLTAGPAIGGVLLKFFSWRAIFYINVPVGILAALLTIRVLRTEPGEVSREPFDLKGSIFLTLTFASALLLLSQGRDWGLGNWRTIAAVAVLAASVPLLVVSEKRARPPLFEPSLLRIRLFTLPVLAAVALFAGLFFTVFLMPFYLTYPAGYGPEHAAAVLVVPFLFLFVLSPLFGSISDRTGSRLITAVGMLVLSGGLLSLASLSADSPFVSIFWRLALVGTGVAMFISPNSAAALSSVPPRHRGVASGAVATARNLGMVLGVATAALLFNSRFTALSGGRTLKDFEPALNPAFMAAFSHALFAGAGIAFIGAVLSLFRGRETLARRK